MKATEQMKAALPSRSGTGWSVEQEREACALYLDAMADAFTGWDGVAVSLREAAKAIRSRVTPSEGGTPRQALERIVAIAERYGELVRRLRKRQWGDGAAAERWTIEGEAADAITDLERELAEKQARIDEYIRCDNPANCPHPIKGDDGTSAQCIANDHCGCIWGSVNRAEKAERQLAEARRAREWK